MWKNLLQYRSITEVKTDIFILVLRSLGVIAAFIMLLYAEITWRRLHKNIYKLKEFILCLGGIPRTPESEPWPVGKKALLLLSLFFMVLLAEAIQKIFLNICCCPRHLVPYAQCVMWGVGAAAVRTLQMQHSVWFGFVYAFMCMIRMALEKSRFYKVIFFNNKKH